MAAGKSHRALAILGAVVSIAIIGLSAFAFWRSQSVVAVNPLSDDATLVADVVQIAAAVPGRIQEIRVRENDMVAKGDLLVQLDDTAYRLAVDQARADLAIAEAANRDQARSIRAEQSNAAIAAEQVSRAQTNLGLANQTLARLMPMRDGGFVSAQQIDDARTVQQNALISLNEALAQRDAAEALISEIEGSVALVNARRAALAIAEYELENTRIFAPDDGRAVGVTATAGNFVLPAQSMFSLIDTRQWYASANFIETVLPNITVGDCATVYALSDRRREIRGRVEGIGWGIATQQLIELPSTLPIVPKSLDWVRVQQRFPVRIALIDPPAELMRVGGSVVAIVHDDKDC